MSLLRLYRDFLPIPDAAANENSAAIQIAIFDAEGKDFSSPHPATGERREKRFPLICSGVHDLPHLVRAVAPLVLDGNLWKSEIPFAPDFLTKDRMWAGQRAGTQRRKINNLRACFAERFWAG